MNFLLLMKDTIHWFTTDTWQERWKMLSMRLTKKLRMKSTLFFRTPTVAKVEQLNGLQLPLKDYALRPFQLYHQFLLSLPCGTLYMFIGLKKTIYRNLFSQEWFFKIVWDQKINAPSHFQILHKIKLQQLNQHKINWFLVLIAFSF